MSQANKKGQSNFFLIALSSYNIFGIVKVKNRGANTKTYKPILNGVKIT